MNEAVAKFAVDAIQVRIGVAVQAQFHEGSPRGLDVSPAGAHPNDSFAVRFSPGWRVAEVHFLPGKFAAPLIAQMGRAPADARSAIAAFATALDARKARLTFRVNGVDVTPLDATAWPTSWARLEMHARSAPQVIQSEDLAQMRQLVSDLVVPFFGILAALVGVEEPEAVGEGEPEGSPYQTLITRYERKKVNREACIQMKGLLCAACGFDFTKFYGDLGAGYVEVHHTTPVSEIGPDYRINVLTDLVPLCANCHAMVHRRNPPIPVDELAELITVRKQE